MNRRKKASKMRGSKTHGGGSMKKRRGAGNRGGRGRAGSGKKGDCKKPSYWKEKPKKGFYSLEATHNSINVSELQDRAETLKVQGKLKTTEGMFDINLKELGYGKLLGTGHFTIKANIIVYEASASAIKKVQTAGGKVTVLKVPKEPKAKPVPKEKKKAPEEPEEAAEEVQKLEEGAE